MAGTKKDVLKILEEISIFPSVLTRLMVEYIETHWIPQDHFALSKNARPQGILVTDQTLIICDYFNHCLLFYTLAGRQLSEEERQSPTSVKTPYGMDIDEDTLYIIDQKQITSLKYDSGSFSTILSFQLPGLLDYEDTDSGRGIKIDNERIYYTINNHHQVLVSKKRDGQFVRTFGKEKRTNERGKDMRNEAGQQPGEFNDPRGITVDEKFLYVCDWLNHRIQVLEKEEGIFQTLWGKGEGGGSIPLKFVYPYSIYLSRAEGDDPLLFIGDDVCIQILTPKGILVERIGDKDEGRKIGQFASVEGLCRFKEKLYISDSRNNRIQVFSQVCAEGGLDSIEKN